MNKIAIVILFTCSALLNAQEKSNKKVFIKVNVEYLSGLDYSVESDDNVFNYDAFYGKNIELGCGVHFTPQLSSSLNIGANRYEKLSANTFPLTLQTCYYLKPQLSSFFGTLKIGPQIKFSEASDKGYVMAFHFGRRFKIKNNFAAKAYLGFNHQKTTDEYVNIGKITRNSLVFGIEIPIF